MTSRLSQVIKENSIRYEYSYMMYSSARERTMILHEMARTDDPFKRDDLFLKLREKGETFLISRQRIIDLGLDEASKELLEKQSS